MLDATRPRRAPNDELRQGPEPERAVRCGACDATIARLGDRTVIGPSDLHTFVNPRGEVFELVCFAKAEGAAALGRGTLEFTWFPGHAWRFAICRACGVQLGWHYEGPTRFWGLDRARLRWPTQDS
ncbi:MAG: hypothetical protein HC927_04670 [Deltaproteobacteria bacterium]|nr:hypothetical protein [Deltaproteobacteria bacterium]